MKEVHFSIDDVGLSFKYLYLNEPTSIFDLRLYSGLRKWHETYGMTVNMYCIWSVDGFNLLQTPEKYRYEFELNSDWLRFGFHSGTDLPFKDDPHYKRSFHNVESFIDTMGMGHTTDIRLHSWIASDEQENFLRNAGITTLFYPDDSNIQYDENGMFFRNGIIHRRTDCWIERMTEINEASIGINKDYLSIFTHEWCFTEQKNRIEMSMRILTENGYCFV